ncbi:tyrosine-type recombinase/integrase [Maritimibacter sp. DP4N28-5]|uniref:Tyrosine-type recombinase/integrase n=1 Tax=Maritimibacter dapengensis TaxID=2836868 RepID=A0ABS6T2L4_9RHOB|nr:tyrosine-type recombinase/integrase [Maritimibacter dapengensis]
MLPVVSRWKAEFQALRSGSTLPLEELAEQWRSDFEVSQGAERETLAMELAEKAREIDRTDPESAERFFNTVTGKNTNLSVHIDDWAASLQGTAKTRDMQVSDVKRFTKSFPNSEGVNRRAVQNWVLSLQREQNLQPGTIRRIVSACRNYWRHLDRLGDIASDADPFKDVAPRKPSRKQAKGQKKWEDFQPKQVVDLYQAALSNGDQKLGQLIYLGMWTGCRIEEICSLKVSDVDEDRFRIGDAKTEAGERTVPIHTELSDMLRTLCRTSKDGYVLCGLTVNKYDDRSNAIGKRFGRLKRSHGFDSHFVFHSIRKTVATMLENAGVPEGVAADILGHEKKTMTYGLYSGGSSFERMSSAISTLQYPF